GPRPGHPGGPTAAGVRTLLHDQTGRDRPWPRASAADGRDASRHDHGLGDAGRRRHVFYRAFDVMSPRILLVDDEPNIRKMVAAWLQSEGFETAEAANGTAGWSAVGRERSTALIPAPLRTGGPHGLATS